MSEPAAVPAHEPVHIIGGSSFWGNVSIRSSAFDANAYHYAGKISVSVQPTAAAIRILLERDRWFIPLVARLIAFLVSSISRTTWIMIAGTHILVRWVIPIFIPPRAPHVPTFFEMYGIPFLFFALLGILTRIYIGPWHAAEHMAIAAYRRTKSLALEDIRKESRIDPHCGGRFVLPMLAASYLSTFLEPRLGINHWIIYLVIVEIVLQIDHHVGLAGLPVFGPASRALQRYVTTREPDERHLRTAQVALGALVAKHQQTSKA